jgi:hypothetical protein
LEVPICVEVGADVAGVTIAVVCTVVVVDVAGEAADKELIPPP